MDGTNNLRISEDVIMKIVGRSINDVEGVSPATSNEIIGRLTNKTAYKGIKVEIKDNEVSVEASVIVNYGVKILDVTTLVQERISKNIEDMCGMSVSKVNIVVSGINMDTQKDENK